MKAKKKFGQNFLVDDSVVNQIIQSIPSSKDSEQIVVEIGPGLGDLTLKLLSHRFDVIAFEIDSELVCHLKDKFKVEIKSNQLDLRLCDVLDVWQENLVEMKYDMVANLPYYVATNMILRALKDTNCRSLRVMIQREVALKFAAKYKDRAFGAISVLASLVGDVRVLFDVSKECFNPSPKVTSSVLSIDKKKDFVVKNSMESEDAIFASQEEFEGFQKFLKVCFSAPRKTLLKNLSKMSDKELLINIFKQLELKYTIRPHEVKALTYKKIYDNIGVRSQL